jgi:hypothetical protein
MENEYRNKKRFLIGIIIVLILINLAAIATFLFQKYDRRRAFNKEGVQKENRNFDRKERLKNYVKKELSLNESQSSVYFQSMDKNFSNSKIAMDNISRIKNNMIQEIFSDKPDTVKIGQLCDSIGFYNVRVQKEMNRHLFDVKKILDTAQQNKLKLNLIQKNKRTWDKEDHR